MISMNVDDIYEYDMYSSWQRPRLTSCRYLAPPRADDLGGPGEGGPHRLRREAPREDHGGGLPSPARQGDGVERLLAPRHARQRQQAPGENTHKRNGIGGWYLSQGNNGRLEWKNVLSGLTRF